MTDAESWVICMYVLTRYRSEVNAGVCANLSLTSVRAC